MKEYFSDFCQKRLHLKWTYRFCFVMIIELFRLLKVPNRERNNPRKFEIDRTILTCIKQVFHVKNVRKNYQQSILERT